MFRTNRPVTASAFHDRTQPLARLEQMVTRLEAGETSWLALIGRRKLGKTSLLLELARRNHHRVIFVILDTLERAPVDGEVLRLLAIRTLDAVLRPVLGASLEALQLDPPSFRAALAPHLAQLPSDTHRLVMDLATVPLTAASLTAMANLPQQLAEARDLRLLCAVDEFQELMTMSKRGRRSSPDLVALLRSVWQHHDRVSYVISGSAPSVLRELVSSQASPFFQHLDVLELDPMSHADAVELLTANGISESVAQRTVELVGGHPFYLQVVGEELLRANTSDHELVDLQEALQTVLFHRTGRLALYLEREMQGIIGRSSQMMALLSHLSEGPRTVTQLSEAMGIRTGAVVGLLDRAGDHITRQDSAYALADPVSALWLRWRRPHGAAVPMSLLGAEGERAVAEALARLGFDLVYQSRASRGAFDLLATRGASQVAVQVKRRALPLVFDLDAWARMEAEAARFGWSWVLAAVEPDTNTVRWLDPAAARIRKTARVDEEIPNLLAWLDAGGMPLA